ncbi:MAG: mechanosensitive ion channel family protein [bacterium]
MDEWLGNQGLETGAVEAVGLVLVLGVATAVHYLGRWALVRAAHGFSTRTTTHWDDELVRAGVFRRLAQIPPAFVVYYGIALFADIPEAFVDGVRRLSVAWMVLFGALAFMRFLRAAEAIYDSHEVYRERPIKGYLQVVSILVTLLAALLILAVLMNRSPWIFVSGIGAMTAVLLLVFRDTILSLVASIQIASNDMIRVGDWIEMPEVGADGDVIEVALHTVKVQNWDKTITTIPTHRLISDSFRNWRGMSLSGGRRIKRAVSIDLRSVRFLTDAEIERFEAWSLLREYIRGKRRELTEANTAPGLDPSIRADLRRLTNLGTFRAWIAATLRTHPRIHQTGYTMIVRQLDPSPKGVPIEIYCFARETAWALYEDIQADLFDRVLAMVPEFGLRVFQEPSGADLERLLTRGRGSGAASESHREIGAGEPEEGRMQA